MPHLGHPWHIAMSGVAPSRSFPSHASQHTSWWPVPCAQRGCLSGKCVLVLRTWSLQSDHPEIHGHLHLDEEMLAVSPSWASQDTEFRVGSTWPRTSAQTPSRKLAVESRILLCRMIKYLPVPQETAWSGSKDFPQGHWSGNAVQPQWRQRVFRNALFAKEKPWPSRDRDDNQWEALLSEATSVAPCAELSKFQSWWFVQVVFFSLCVHHLLLLLDDRAGHGLTDKLWSCSTIKVVRGLQTSFKCLHMASLPDGQTQWLGLRYTPSTKLKRQDRQWSLAFARNWSTGQWQRKLRNRQTWVSRGWRRDTKALPVVTRAKNTGQPRNACCVCEQRKGGSHMGLRFEQWLLVERSHRFWQWLCR